jgi:hypothetical protein
MTPLEVLIQYAKSRGFTYSIYGDNCITLPGASIHYVESETKFRVFPRQGHWMHNIGICVSAADPECFEILDRILETVFPLHNGG